MGEKATVSRISFEAVVALGILLLSLLINMTACVSNTWFWHKEGEDMEIVHTLGIWKEIICTKTETDPCSNMKENFEIPAWSRATAAFAIMALLIHLGATISSFLYVFFRRNKRFMFGTAVAILVSGILKCLSALIFGFGASRAFDGWLDWAFALLLITMSLDWTAGLVSLVEYTEARLLKPDEHRRGPKNKLGVI